MSHLVLVDLPVKLGTREDATALFAEMLPDTRAFDGCELATLHGDQDDETRLILVERWASPEQHATYREWRASQGDTRLAAFLAGAPTMRVLDDLA